MNQATSERHEQASVRYDWNEVVRLQHQSRIDSGAHGPSSSSPTRHLPSGNQVQRWLPTRSMDRLRLGRWNSSPGVPSPAPSWPMCQPAQSSSESVISQMRSVKVRLWTSPHPILPLKPSRSANIAGAFDTYAYRLRSGPPGDPSRSSADLIRPLPQPEKANQQECQTQHRDEYVAPRPFRCVDASYTPWIRPGIARARACCRRAT
jgi:hypothetical protein